MHAEPARTRQQGIDIKKHLNEAILKVLNGPSQFTGLFFMINIQNFGSGQVSTTIMSKLAKVISNNLTWANITLLMAKQHIPQSSPMASANTPRTKMHESPKRRKQQAMEPFSAAFRSLRRLRAPWAKSN